MNDENGDRTTQDASEASAPFPIMPDGWMPYLGYPLKKEDQDDTKKSSDAISGA